MLLTDPEIESSLLISSDEGATYQKYRLNFYIQSLLFHPKQEDWILAYSQDQKVSAITLLETIAHGFPGNRLLANCLCVSSRWWLWFGAVAWTLSQGVWGSREDFRMLAWAVSTSETACKARAWHSGRHGGEAVLNLDATGLKSSQPLWNLRLFCACGDMTVFLDKGLIAFLKAL